ncbi:Ras-related protein Rab-22A [Tritrichomonas foetus]|uniref:Ras-related protein Rab-22A n=1 Tax=Tritrichomonas foetus TaxID=1144522 RepID=A0A1J4JPK3_9EUKA|nr:Ras-related protein Rab-22A [Tritrichomonas foetus]|eukprot:OHT00328.1 Ras-related protein Rab-22A [Tritrichomonas foetus]
MSMCEPNERNYKVCFLGPTAVGKTSIIHSYLNQELSSIDPTIAAISNEISIAFDMNIIKLSISDTAGQEAFRSITPIYYRNADCIVFVFDVTERQSLTDLKRYIQEVKDNMRMPMTVLVANKIDLTDGRVVSQEKIKKIKEKYEMTYFIETSAITKSNINELFELIAGYFAEESYHKVDSGISIDIEQKQASSSCC